MGGMKFGGMVRGFLGSVRVEVDGFESLQDRGRSGELLRVMVSVRLGLVVAFAVGEGGNDEDGADHELEEEEEDSGSEPTVDDSPD